ncbi:MAG: hypothetical protein Q7U91_05705 [Sideroxyarcus sp.]|nr:hypothetical protein [Sideroxyarcus sp.]
MKILSRLAQLGVMAAALSVGLLAACGGGGASSSTVGFEETYTSSAGAGEVMQFRINTTNHTYTYTIAGTSYAASGVAVGQSSSGALTSNGDGTYAVGASGDGFIQAGRVRPIRAMFVGHVAINAIGGTERIPVFGLSNPITTVAGLADSYNFEGFSCNARGMANVTGRAGCRSHYGTSSIDTSGNYSVCINGDLGNTGAHPCTSTLTGTLQAVAAYPGVFDYIGASGHIGWLFAFTASNGKKIMVIDHDDHISLTHEFGHSVFTSSVALNSGDVDGKYFVKSNEGDEHLVTIAGSSVALTLHPGVTGTLTYNSPWNGMMSYDVPASGVSLGASGVAMAAGTGVYTSVSNVDPARFAVGFKYQ